MIIFGWLCLLALTGYFVFAAIGSAYVTLCFAGKIEGATYVFAVIAAALIYATCVNFPFIIEVAK